MTMTTNDRAEVLVLHWLRIKGMATPTALAALTGHGEGEVGQVLERAVAQDLAAVREGRAGTTYRLTPQGKERAGEALQDMVAATGERPAWEHVDQAFLPLNDRLKEVTSAWQVRDGAPNDHSDPAYDDEVVGHLAHVHEGLTAAVTAAPSAPPRLLRYSERLAAALKRVRAGEHAAFARPMADSYHDAWMELHQDLLLTLGRERGAADGH